MTQEMIEEFKKLKRVEAASKSKIDLRKFTLLANFSAANTEFYKKYGDITAPLIYKSYDGSDMMSSGYKGWFRFTKNEDGNDCSETEAFKKPLSETEVFLPHEEAEQVTFKAVKNFNNNFNNEFGELKLVDDTREANHGYTKYWRFMSDKKHNVKKGDTVQFGINFRNGIGTSISLGGDLYSYRLACLNGAVVKDAKMGSFNIPHRISTSRMLERLTDGLGLMIDNYKQILEVYKAFSVTKLTQKLLNQILAEVDIPLIYLPPHIVDVITKKEDKNIIRNSLVKLRRTDFTLWDFFNGITEPLSRGIGMKAGTESYMTSEQKKKIKNIQFKSFVNKTSQLHRAMIPLVKI